ncbi:MAG: class I SAM-dependent methyltransferase [Acutalibacteraceae bacterium]|nr:class I SAM-dependent methyltransferase [Acutalibacteraceae bacterium]
MNLKSAVEKNWSYEAEQYSKNVKIELESSLPEQWISLIEKYINQTNYKNILDIGTGPGFFPIILSKHGYTVTGIDCTPAMLEEAKKNLQMYNVSAELFHASGEQLPFTNESFDCVISRNVTWTLLDTKQSYQEWLRVLRPGGKILIFDANWNLKYHDPELMKHYQQAKKDFRDIFGEDYSVIHDLSEEAENYRKNMPMSKVKRPQWDFNILSDLDVKSICCETDVSNLIWGKKKQIAYRATPMFFIVAEKK